MKFIVGFAVFALVSARKESEIKDLVQLNYLAGGDLLESQTTDAEVEALHKEIDLAKTQAKTNVKLRKLEDAVNARHQLVEDRAYRMKHLQIDGLFHLKDGTRVFPNGNVVDGVNGALVQNSEDGMEELGDNVKIS